MQWKREAIAAEKADQISSTSLETQGYICTYKFTFFSYIWALFSLLTRWSAKMERLKCTVTYDGTHFHGYQIQINKRTVQLVIEDVLRKIHKGTNVRIHASGRTDATVHAKGQVFHFDSPLSFDGSNNGFLLSIRNFPEDVASP